MSGNLSPLVVQTSEALPVFLTVGGEILLSETYYPGDGNLVEVDFRDVVESCLAFSFPDQDIFTQPTLARTFTVLFGAAQTVTFTAVRSGKAHLNESASSFLKGNFLTWQPTTKYVTYYSPEWLTYFAVESCSIVLKAYFSGGETQLISLTSLSAGSCVTVNLQYAVVCGKLSNRRPMYYDVWAQGSSGARLTYIQRYMASAPQSPDESWYLFENSLGGLDSLRAYGSLDFAPEFEHQIAQTSDGLQEYRIDTSRVYTRYTGYLNPAEAKWLQDLFSARQKYAYTHSGYYRIVFTSSDGAYSGADMPSSYSFSYRFAEDDPFLDIQRDEDLPENIEIALPDQEAFFLPPRLAEYPKLEGNEDTLLLSQQPHTEEWGTLTFGEIVNGILDKLVARLEGLKLHLSGIGGGGSGDIYLITSFDLTAPSDTNAFSALRTLIEIEKAIDNSFWDIVGELDERYLRKDVDDTAHGNILFEKKIGSLDFIEGWDEGIGWEIQEDGGAVFGQANVRGNAIIGNRMGSPLFVSGFPNGVGWDLSPYKQLNAAGAEETKWRLEIDDINVRGRLRVYEFIISQLRGENDNVIFAGMMKVDHYDEATRRIYLDTDEGILYNPFRPGDILMVQRYGGMPTEENDYNVIKQYELRVDQAEVGDLSEGEKRLDWITFTNFVGTLSDIARGDVLTRVDSVTDLTRKGIVKVTTIDEIGAPYIDVVYGMKTDPENATKARMGNLTGIRTKSGIDLTGVWGIYGNGAYFENSTYILDTGNTIEQQFSVLGGEFDSKINAIRTDISEESGNLLRNGSFASDTNYWTASNEIHYIDVGGQFLWLGGAFYVDKTKVADIVSDSGRNVLRVRNTSIYQANDVMLLPKREETEEDGYTYSFSLFYRATRTGILKVGVPGSELYQEIDIEPNDNYSRITHAAKWDEKGDFRIECSGEVYVYGVVLYDDATADAIIRLETRIEQTEEYIKLLATKEYVDEETGEIYKKYDAQLSVMADDITARVTYEDYNTQSQALEKRLESQITLTENRITASVTEQVNTINAAIEAAQTAIGEAEEATKDVADSVSNLNDYVDGAFKDGVIEDAEKISIGKYINTVDSTMSDVEATYTKLYANTYLEGTPKSNLKTAYDNLNSAYDSLVAAIEDATADSTASEADFAAVNTQFATFNSRLSTFKTSIESANKAIQDKLKGYSDSALAAANAANAAASKAQESANSVGQSVTDLDNEIKGSFRDGIITDAEKISIGKYINTVDSTMSDVEATYTKLYANTYLEGTPKSNLKTAYDNLNSAYDSLVAAIEDATADSTASEADFAAVNTQFATFNSRLSTFKTSIESANKAIQDKLNELANTGIASVQADLNIEKDKITANVEAIDNINNTIKTSGWITATDGNTLYASKSLENGDEIISYINQTATTLTISASRVNLNGAITINSLGYSLQQTIDGKVNRDDVGDLAYRNDVSYSYLDIWLRDYVDGKASMTDLAEYVLTTELNSKLTGYEKVGAAEDVQDYLINILLNGTTTILGGYISTSLINADWVVANAASIGGFTIMSNVLTGDGMTLNPSTGLFFEGNSTSAAVGSSVISGATGVRCPMVAKNKYGSGGYYDNGAALILVVGSAAYNDTSQVWLSCQHDGGYGSKFMVESRYVSEISDKSFNSTVLNLGHLLKSGQVSRINSSATTKSYLCLMSDSSNNSYLCIDNG